MARLTPEQEAAYALDYGVSRADLKPPVQAEYDRLLAGRPAARPPVQVYAPQTPLPVEYRRPGSQVTPLVGLGVCSFLFVLMVGDAMGSALAGLVAGAVLAAAIGSAVAATSRLVMLRADLISIRHGTGFTSIGMNEIAGVGLLYIHMVASRGDWRLYIWRDLGPPQPAGFSYRQGWGSPRYNPVADTELLALAASRAAVVCRDIYYQVLTAQGSAGPLATRQLQKHQPPALLSRNSEVIAYWSPDGEAGYCREQPGTGEVHLIGYPPGEQAPHDGARHGSARPAAPGGPHEPYWRRWLVEDEATDRKPGSGKREKREPPPADARRRA